MWRDDRNKFAEVAQEHVRLSIEMPEKDYFPIPTAWKAGGILNKILQNITITFDTIMSTEKNIKLENLIYECIQNSIFHRYRHSVTILQFLYFEMLRETRSLRSNQIVAWSC